MSSFFRPTLKCICIPGFVNEIQKHEYELTSITWYLQNVVTTTPTPLTDRSDIAKPDTIVAVLGDNKRVWFGKVLCVLYSQLKLQWFECVNQTRTSTTQQIYQLSETSSYVSKQAVICSGTSVYVPSFSNINYQVFQ
jgi:hypothetical protein